MRRLAVLVLVALAPAGCYSKVTAYDGKFTLGYASGVEVENFVKPIAPGAKLDVEAFANGTTNELTITKATSSRPNVLAVDGVKGGRLTLKGVAPGVAEIEVSAKGRDGGILVDKMFFHVGKPATHGLEHACTEEPNAAYVKGDFVDVFHNLATADGRPVVGYGYAPVKVEPSGALQLVAQPQGWALYRYKASSAKAKVTLRSTIDDKTITARIVERGDLTDAQLLHSDRILEGDSQYAVARVRLADTTLCSQNALTKAKSLTPEICKVTARLDEDPDEEDANHEQLAVVTGLKFGVCEYEVSLPELAGGKGVVLKGRTKVGREEYPSQGGAAAPTVARHEGLRRIAGWFVGTRVLGLLAIGVWLSRSRRARAARSA